MGRGGGSRRRLGLLYWVWVLVGDLGHGDGRLFRAGIQVGAPLPPPPPGPLRRARQGSGT